MKHTAKLMFALGAMALAAGAQASTIYKYRAPDGSIAYSNSRPAGVAIIEEMDSSALANDPQTMYRGAATTRAPVTGDVDARLQRIARADAAVDRAQTSLQNAKDALERGREPQPGERTGTVSGFTRLNEAYYARISALEQAVAAAQQQLDDAYRARREA